VILIRSGSLRPVKAERINSANSVGRIDVGIHRQKRVVQAVDGRCARQRGENRLTLGIHSVRISAEVVIEGIILLEDHHEVLDRSNCAGRRGLLGAGCDGTHHGAGNQQLNHQ